MSRYLIRRIEEHPRVTLRVRTEIVALEGQDHLERVRWRNSASGETGTGAIRHVFVKTGPDLGAHDLAAAEWPLSRAPYLLETSVPGIFAVGDVRSGNVKRVASAVGEGSICVQL